MIRQGKIHITEKAMSDLTWAAIRRYGISDVRIDECPWFMGIQRSSVAGQHLKKMIFVVPRIVDECAYDIIMTAAENTGLPLRSHKNNLGERNFFVQVVAPLSICRSNDFILLKDDYLDLMKSLGLTMPT